MKILFITNNAQRCGIAEYGRHHANALVKLGHEVTVVFAPVENGPPYIPQQVNEDFDVCHVNWHPMTLGHLHFVHLDDANIARRLTSCFFHESVPHWEKTGFPKLWQDMDASPARTLKYCSEPMDGAIFFRVPVWDIRPRTIYHPLDERPVIGYSGIRRDGEDRILFACEKNGWAPNGPSAEWLRPDEEVDRLALSTVNIIHYHGGYSGQASAVGPILAAGRPVIINSNRMLKTWAMFDGYGLYLRDDLEAGVREVLDDLKHRHAEFPTELADRYSWHKMAQQMTHQWEGGLG